MRPNIIFIVADDLGFADLGCYGGRDNPKFGRVSPVLDSLAAGGVRFTDGYSNSPVCSPTRFALITGRYQYRLRGAADEPMRAMGASRHGLPPEHPTLPSLVRNAGYRTALIGKWHLGYPPHFGPIKSGYDEFFGPLSGGVDYFTHCGTDGQHDLWSGEERRCEEGYLTDLLSRRAVEYIDRAASRPAGEEARPFFLSLHFTAPHWPWESRDDAGTAAGVAANLFHLHGGSVDTYQRMIHHMDEGIGSIMDALRRNGMERDTLVIFTSDNGGERFSDNWPLVGGKMDLTEGGIRVPWIAHWPAVIPAGTITSQHCMTMDWMATCLDAAAADAHPEYPLDGVSMLPVLRNPAATFPRPLYWRMNHRGQRALREGAWKYLRVDGCDYLFDVSADPRERANQATRDAGRLAAMRESWENWNASLPQIPPDATVSPVYSTKDMPQR